MKLWELDVGSSEVHGGGGSKSTYSTTVTQTVPDFAIHVKRPAGPWPLQDATETRQSECI
jgi:hypothetical protein